MKNAILNILGMHCVSCAANIEAALKKSIGVLSAPRINFASEKAYIEYEPERINERELISIIEKLGCRAQLQVIKVDHLNVRR